CEPAGLRRRERTGVRVEGQLVELLTAETPLLRDHLRTLALAEGIPAVALLDRGAEGLAGTVGALRAHGHARHRLDTTGDDDVAVACCDRGDREGERLLRRAA